MKDTYGLEDKEKIQRYNTDKSNIEVHNNQCEQQMQKAVTTAKNIK